MGLGAKRGFLSQSSVGMSANGVTKVTLEFDLKG